MSEKLQEVLDNAPADSKELKEYIKEHFKLLHTNPKYHK